MQCVLQVCKQGCRWWYNCSSYGCTLWVFWLCPAPTGYSCNRLRCDYYYYLNESSRCIIYETLLLDIFCSIRYHWSRTFQAMAYIRGAGSTPLNYAACGGNLKCCQVNKLSLSCINTLYFSLPSRNLDNFFFYGSFSEKLLVDLR